VTGDMSHHKFKVQLVDLSKTDFVQASFVAAVAQCHKTTSSLVTILNVYEIGPGGEPEGESEAESEGESEAESEGEREAESEGQSEAESGGESEAESGGESEAESEGQSEAESEGESEAESEGESEAESEGESEAESESESEAESEGEREAESEGESEAASEGESEATSEGESEAASEGESEAASEGESEAESEGESEVESEGESEAESEGESEAESEGESEAASEGESEAASEGESEVESEGESEAESEGESEAESEGEAEGPVTEGMEGGSRNLQARSVIHIKPGNLRASRVLQSNPSPTLVVVYEILSRDLASIMPTEPLVYSGSTGAPESLSTQQAPEEPAGEEEEPPSSPEDLNRAWVEGAGLGDWYYWHISFFGVANFSLMCYAIFQTYTLFMEKSLAWNLRSIVVSQVFVFSFSRVLFLTLDAYDWNWYMNAPNWIAFILWGLAFPAELSTFAAVTLNVYELHSHMTSMRQMKAFLPKLKKIFLASMISMYIIQFVSDVLISQNVAQMGMIIACQSCLIAFGLVIAFFAFYFGVLINRAFDQTIARAKTKSRNVDHYKKAYRVLLSLVGISVGMMVSVAVLALVNLLYNATDVLQTATNSEIQGYFAFLSVYRFVEVVAMTTILITLRKSRKHKALQRELRSKTTSSGLSRSSVPVRLMKKMMSIKRASRSSQETSSSSTSQMALQSQQYNDTDRPSSVRMPMSQIQSETAGPISFVRNPLHSDEMLAKPNRLSKSPRPIVLKEQEMTAVTVKPNDESM